MEVLLDLKHKRHLTHIYKLPLAVPEAAKTIRCCLQTSTAIASRWNSRYGVASSTVMLKFTHPESYVLMTYAMLVSGGVGEKLLQKSAGQLRTRRKLRKL
jgi:hypothetical protein